MHRLFGAEIQVNWVDAGMAISIRTHRSGIPDRGPPRTYTIPEMSVRPIRREGALMITAMGRNGLRDARQTYLLAPEDIVLEGRVFTLSVHCCLLPPILFHTSANTPPPSPSHHDIPQVVGPLSAYPPPRRLQLHDNGSFIIWTPFLYDTLGREMSALPPPNECSVFTVLSPDAPEAQPDAPGQDAIAEMQLISPQAVFDQVHPDGPEAYDALLTIANAPPPSPSETLDASLDAIPEVSLYGPVPPSSIAPANDPPEDEDR